MSLKDKEYLQVNQALFSLAHAYDSRMARELNSRRLSGLMDINPGTISLYVQRLVVKGIVKREQDGNDRRNWWLSLTESGQEVYRQTITGTIVYTRDFLSALSTPEQHVLHELLLKVSRSLGFDWQ